jgi:hypothetical protein
MAVIDELVISLSLNASNFNAQQQQAINTLKKFEQQATATATNTERGAQKMVDGFSRVTKEVLGVVAAILGVNGLKDLAVNLTTMAAATERMAGAFEIEPETLNKWQEFFKAIGQQDFSTTSSSLGALSKAIQEFRATQQGPLLAAIPWLSKLHISPADIMAGTPSQALNTMLLKAGANINNPENKGIQAEILSHIPGMTPPMMESLKTAPTQKVLDSYLSATAEQMRSAAHMMKEIEDLARELRKKLNTYLPDADKVVTGVVGAGKKLIQGDVVGAFEEGNKVTLPPYLETLRKLQGAIEKPILNMFSAPHPDAPAKRIFFPDPGPLGAPPTPLDTSTMPRTPRFPDGRRSGGNVTNNNITANISAPKSDDPQTWADRWADRVTAVMSQGGSH